MSIHELHCQEPWFHLLEEGKKSVEGRLNRDSCSLINAGDQIKFYNGDQSFLLTVMKVQHFATLTQYLETVGLQCALPGVKTIKEGCEVYLKFYSDEDIRNYGVLAFWVQHANVHIKNKV